MGLLQALESLRVQNVDAACSWIVTAIGGAEGTVGSLVPRGFAGYARIGNLQSSSSRRAAPDESHPYSAEGTLSAPVLERLIANVESLTPDSACLFAYWDGWAWLHGPPQHQSLPPEKSVRPEASLSGELLPLPHRDYRVYQGSLHDVRSFSTSAKTYAHSPNLWWSTDRTWIAVTDIDLPSTFIGGPPNLVEGLAQDPALSAQRVSLSDRL